MNSERRQLEYANVKAYVENTWPRQQLRWGPGHPPELDRQPCIQRDIQLLDSLSWRPLSRPKSSVWAEAAGATWPPTPIECQDGAELWALLKELLEDGKLKACPEFAPVSIRVGEGELLNRLLESMHHVVTTEQLRTYKVARFDQMARPNINYLLQEDRNGKHTLKPVKILFTFYATGRRPQSADTVSSRSASLYRSWMFTMPGSSVSDRDTKVSSYSGGRGDSSLQSKSSDSGDTSFDTSKRKDMVYCAGSGEEGDKVQQQKESNLNVISEEDGPQEEDSLTVESSTRAIGQNSQRLHRGSIQETSGEEALAMKNDKKKIVPEDMTDSIVCFHKDHDSDDEANLSAEIGNNATLGHQNELDERKGNECPTPFISSNVFCLENSKGTCRDTYETIKSILHHQKLLYHRPMMDPSEHVVVSDDEGDEKEVISTNHLTRSAAKSLKAYMNTRHRLRPLQPGQVRRTKQSRTKDEGATRPSKKTTKEIKKLAFCGFRPGLDLKKQRVTDSLKVQQDGASNDASSFTSFLPSETTNNRGALDKRNFRVSFLSKQEYEDIPCETYIVQSPFDTKQLNIRHSILRMRDIVRRQQMERCMYNGSSKLKVICKRLDKFPEEDKSVSTNLETDTSSSSTAPSGTAQLSVGQTTGSVHLTNTPEPSAEQMGPSSIQGPIFPKQLPETYDSQLLEAVSHFVVRKEQVTLSDSWQSVVSLTFTRITPSRATSDVTDILAS